MTPSQQASLAAILLDLRAGQHLYYAHEGTCCHRVIAIGAVEGETEWCATLDDNDIVYLNYVEPGDFIVGARVELPH